MATKVAPEQGWGIYWNEFHPSQPFTPVEVTLGQVSALPAVAVPAGLAPAQAHGVTASSPAVATIAQADLLQAPQVVLGPEQGANVHLTVGPQGGSAASHSDLAVSFAQTHFSENGWYVVPSMANEFGQAEVVLGTDVGTGWSVADWSLVPDWYMV